MCSLADGSTTAPMRQRPDRRDGLSFATPPCPPPSRRACRSCGSGEPAATGPRGSTSRSGPCLPAQRGELHQRSRQCATFSVYLLVFVLFACAGARGGGRPRGPAGARVPRARGAAARGEAAGGQRHQHHHHYYHPYHHGGRGREQQQPDQVVPEAVDVEAEEAAEEAPEPPPPYPGWFGPAEIANWHDVHQRAQRGRCIY